MQKTKLLKSTAIAIPLVLLVSFGASSAYAAQVTSSTTGGAVTTQMSQKGGMGHGRGGMMGGANDANRTAMEAAITANDFAKFQTLSANSPLSTITTQAQFDQLVKAQGLMKSGDTVGAKAIFDTLGLKGPMGKGGHDGMGRGGFGNQAAHTAVAAGDYTAWKTAMASYKDQSKLTQDLFDKMVQVEKLQKEIRETLGTPTI